MYGDELFTLHMQTRRLTYENARRIHEGWYAEEDDEPVGPSGTDDPWEVMPCGHMQGELHDCEPLRTESTCPACEEGLHLAHRHIST